MKPREIAYLAGYGFKTVVLRQRKPIIAGIRTLPMVLGVSRTKKLYYILTVGPYLLAAAAILVDRAFWPMAAVTISLPRALKTVQDLRGTDDDVEDIRQKSLKHPYPLNSIRLYVRFTSITAASIALVGLIRLFA